MTRERPYKKWIKALKESEDSDVEARLLEQKEQTIPILRVALQEYQKTAQRKQAWAVVFLGALLHIYYRGASPLSLIVLYGSLLFLFGPEDFPTFAKRLIRSPMHYLSHVASVALEAEGEGKLSLLLELWRKHGTALSPEIACRLLFALNRCFQTLDQDHYDALSLENRKGVRALMHSVCRDVLMVDNFSRQEAYTALADTLLRMYRRVTDVQIIFDLEALLNCPGYLGVHSDRESLRSEIHKTEDYVLEVLRTHAPNRDLLRPATLKSEERKELLRASHSQPTDAPELLVRPSQEPEETLEQRNL